MGGLHYAYRPFFIQNQQAGFSQRGIVKLAGPLPGPDPAREISGYGSCHKYVPSR
jgi:hypothetical protein